MMASQPINNQRTPKVFVFGTRGFPGIQGGVEKHCQLIYSRLAKKGVYITILARVIYFTEKTKLKEWKGINFKYIWCPKFKNFEAIIHSFLATMYCVWRRPDIVYVHTIGPGFFIPILKLAGIKTVLVYHSKDYERKKWSGFAKWFLKLSESISVKAADKIIAISPILSKMITKDYKRKSAMIANGVEICDEGYGINTLIRYGCQKDKYILAVGRLVPEKGYDLLIEAFNDCKNNNEHFLNEEWKLIIVGGADHKTSYNNQLNIKSEKNKNIILTGFLEGEQLWQLYRHAGIYVLPSYLEGFSVSFLEALSFGLPIIASDIPENYIVECDSIQYFKSGNSKELAMKIIDMFSDPISEKDRMTQIDMVYREYNWDKIANLTHKHLLEVLGFSI